MDPLQSFLSHLSPSRAKSPTPPTKPSQFSQSKPSQTPQTTKSRFRRHPPPELPLQSHKLSSSVSSSNLLAPHTPNAVAINPSASTSNLRATSPSPEDRPSRTKRLGMLAQPFHLPRARSPKPVKPRIQPVAEDAPDETPSFSSLSPPLPKTESSSSLAAPSVPARSPLRGTPRSVGSFSSLLNTYQDASHSGSTLGLALEPAPVSDTGWTQLLPTPPSPSVYSPVQSVFPEEERRVRRSASMRAVGGERSVSASTTVGRGPRLDALRMPTTRARSASTSSPMLYEDGEMEPNNEPIERTSMDRAVFRPTTRRVASNSRPSTSMNLPTIRDSAIAIQAENKDLPPPPPPKLHVRLQSEFTVPEFVLMGESTRGVTTVDRGQGVSPSSADSGESSGFETAASHTNNTSLDTRRPSTSLSFNPHTRPGTSASTTRPTPNMVITLPLPSHPPPSESASTRTSVSQASLLIDSPERPYPHKPSSPPDEQPPPKSKRTHALLELLSSERAYASDLALIRDIYLPLARGLSTSYPLPPSVGSLMFPGPGPSRVRRPTDKKPDDKKPNGKSNGSIKTNGSSKTNGASSRLSGGEKPSSPDDPPMSAQDVKIIFGNIEELAAFADELSERLEAALGAVVPGGVGEDAVGELFCELAPRMAPMYLTYITRHPAAVERYTALSTTPSPAMAQYLATTRAMTSSITHAWDIPSLIIKPLQRLLKYPLILQTILDNTPVTMGHKDRATLHLAKDKMEQVARQVNEGRRRWEVVKGVLESGKSPPSSAKRMKTFRGRTSTNDTEAQADLVKLEKRVKQGADAANAMAEHVAGWANELTAGAVRLLAWSRAFARVVDLDVLLGGDPQGGSEAVRAFTTVAGSLEDLSRELAAVIKEELVPQLQRLAKTAREPLLLLAHMQTLASAHHNLVNAPYSKSRPAALQEASQAYLALAAQLREELPRYVDMFERAFGIIVLRLSGWQARYFQEAERRWKDFWLALNVEESEVGAGESAAVETVRIWWSRWEATARQTAGMSIVTPGKRVYTRQPVTPTSDSASWDYVPPYHSKPSALSLGDQQSAASSSSAKGHSRAVSTDRGTQRQSDPPKGKKSQKGSNLRRVTDTLFGGTPGERSSAHSSSSRIQQPVLYTAAAIHPFNPETEATHLGLPFLTLRIGDTLEILVEAGHPSEHSNLPIPYDDAPDCMLAARNEDGLEGWALASYLMPLP